MTASRPTVVTPEFAAAINSATLDLADRIRTLANDTTDQDQDPAGKVADEFITALCRRGWRPTAAVRGPDWRAGRPAPPEVARRGAAAARELLSRSDHPST